MTPDTHLVFPRKVPFWKAPSLWLTAALFLLLPLVSDLGRERWFVFLAVWMAFLLAGLFLGRIKARPLIEMDQEHLRVRRTDHTPVKEWQFAIADVEKIEIFGPKGRRFWRVHLKHGDPVEIPPMGNGWIDKPMTRFMSDEVAKRVRIEVKPPPSLFAEIRGDYE